VNVDVFVITNSEIPAFTLSGQIEITGIKSFIRNEKLYGSINMIKIFNYKIAKTEIGSFDDTIVADLLNLGFAYGLVDFVNTELSTGYTLSLPTGVSLVSPVFYFSNYATLLVTDIQYSEEIHSKKLPITIL